jgi:hypothetical protein
MTAWVLGCLGVLAPLCPCVLVPLCTRPYAPDLTHRVVHQRRIAVHRSFYSAVKYCYSCFDTVSATQTPSLPMSFRQSPSGDEESHPSVPAPRLYLRLYLRLYPRLYLRL